MAEDDQTSDDTVALPGVDPRIGTVMADRYRVLARLGRGGMGAVYEVEHITTGKRFALKTLLPGLGKVSEISRRFEREARAVSRLTHPNIVTVSDFGALDDDGSLYLVMELVRGRSLGDVLESEIISPARAFAVVRQVLEALEHAHANGVVHRDLKPDNIMLVDTGRGDDERDVVKLLDFGIAKVEDSGDGEQLTQAGIAFGTPDYMSPEQALGEEVDARGDLYAVGVILFQTLTGRLLYESNDKVSILRMQVAVPPPSLASAAPMRIFAPDTEALVARALEKRRDDRFPTAAAMVASLDVAAVAQDALDVDVAGAIAEETARTLQGIPPTPDMPPPTVRAGRLRGWWAGLPSRVRLGAGIAAFMLVPVIVVATHCGGSDPQTNVSPAIPIAAPSKPAYVEQAEKLLEAGKVDAAIGILELEAKEDDAFGHLVLGHARVRRGKDLEALVAYDVAVRRYRALGADPTLRRNVAQLLKKKDKRVVLPAIDLLPLLGSHGEDLLVDQAATAKMWEARKRARDLADKLGVAGKVDLLASLGADLVELPRCKERKEVVAKLRALEDKRAVPLLKKAKGRTGGILGLEDVNDCLAKDAQEAIEYLEAL
jgi:eukaryotic-like serine/threonine-protein kinase